MQREAAKSYARTLLIAFLLTLCLALAAAAANGDTYSETEDGQTFIRDSSLPDGNTFREEVVGDRRFEIRRLKGGKADIDVYVKDKLLFSVPDITAYFTTGTWPPGGTNLVYMFYLSPRHDYLLVVRGLWHEVNIVYFYARVNGKMQLVANSGLRLDEFLIKEYARSRHTHLVSLETGARSFTFLRWLPDGHGVEYNMFACSYWDGEEPPPSRSVYRYWMGDIDLHTLRMSKTQTLSRVGTQVSETP
jgi:hypothetical protein